MLINMTVSARPPATDSRGGEGHVLTAELRLTQNTHLHDATKPYIKQLV